MIQNSTVNAAERRIMLVDKLKFKNRAYIIVVIIISRGILSALTLSPLIDIVSFFLIFNFDNIGYPSYSQHANPSVIGIIFHTV